MVLAPLHDKAILEMKINSNENLNKIDEVQMKIDFE